LLFFWSVLRFQGYGGLSLAVFGVCEEVREMERSGAQRSGATLTSELRAKSRLLTGARLNRSKKM
jgi:hypothetical protein